MEMIFYSNLKALKMIYFKDILKTHKKPFHIQSSHAIPLLNYLLYFTSTFFVHLISRENFDILSPKVLLNLNFEKCSKCIRKSETFLATQYNQNEYIIFVESIMESNYRGCIVMNAN